MKFTCDVKTVKAGAEVVGCGDVDIGAVGDAFAPDSGSSKYWVILGLCGHIVNPT